MEGVVVEEQKSRSKDWSGGRSRDLSRAINVGTSSGESDARNSNKVDNERELSQH